MSFFIRKKSKNLSNLTRPVGTTNGIGGGGGQTGQRVQQRNTDFKPRPKNRPNKQFGNQKRPKPSDSTQRGYNNNNNQGKRQKLDNDEEIESSSDDEGDDGLLLDEERRKSGISAKSGDSDEEFYSAEDDVEDETAQEKKLRLAKVYLEEIEKEERNRRENDEVDTDVMASRLKDDVLEAEGRLRKEVADQVEPDLENITVLTCSKYLKRSVTCLCISEDDQWIFSGSKDGHLIKWSVPEKKKVAMVKRKEGVSKKKKRNKGNGRVNKQPSDPNQCHSSSILAIAVSSDGKFLATGDAEKQIVIWDPATLKKIHIFSGHRGPVRGLVFRKKSHTLYSCSDDRSVRVWSLDEMGYVETLFGHQDVVTCIDALSRERAVTGGGRDSTIRIWKIVEESQLVYNGHYNGNIDCVKLINEENFLSGGDDGLLCVWNVNRKKPLVSREKPHGFTITNSDGSEVTEIPRWISSVAAWTNTDLVASGSSDGHLRFWKCGERFKSLTEVFSVPCPGWVNSIAFSSSTDGVSKNTKFLAVGTGKEHRLGRWFDNIKEAKDGIMLIPLRQKSKDVSNSFDSNLLTSDESS